MLKVSQLSTHYGSVKALHNVSFTAEQGKITTVIGANGAGKSTLLRTISALVKPESGSITWKGRELVGASPESIVRSGVAHVPEGHAVISQLTVEENIKLGSLFRRRKFASDISQATKEMFDLFPRLQERRTQLAGSLSGGERQMLAISRALVSRPEVLLLDEPSLGLAPLVVEQIIQSINDLCRKTGLTVLLVEQNANTALSVADHGVLLALGEVAADRPAAELMADTALRAAYLGY
ncbi:MAG: ABC transporter ATP-binding protein [Actinobacteria bacterium]|jgi:branched-chain amino acid transport system ATP-binding protein|nr:ABC transporter ATP-binding protein [Actinomycetota bacterium]